MAYDTALPQGRRQGGAFVGRAPPNELLCPPTFHPLPSLLNVIDFESESETDKTVHIRKRLHALAASATARNHRLHASHPNPPPDARTHTHTHTHTHNVIWAPPRNSNAPLMEVPWCWLCTAHMAIAPITAYFYQFFRLWVIIFLTYFCSF